MKTLSFTALLMALTACGGDATMTDTSEAQDKVSSAAPSPSDSLQSQSADASEELGLTGYGATVEAWQEERGESVSGFTAGSVYGPVVRDDTHQYFAVIADERVTMYTRAFPPRTDLKTAETLVLQDFPADARIAARDTDEPSCVIELVNSAKVRQATGSHAVVAYFSGQDPSDTDRTPLDRSDVAYASVMTSYGSGKRDLGRC